MSFGADLGNAEQSASEGRKPRTPRPRPKLNLSVCTYSIEASSQVCGACHFGLRGLSGYMEDTLTHRQHLNARWTQCWRA